MKILINAASANMGGALTYLTNILREIPAVSDGDKFFVIVPAKTKLLLENSCDKSIFTFIECPVKPRQNLRRTYFDNWTVRRLAIKHRCDVLFSPTGFGIYWSPCPQVLLIRNAAYFCPLYKKKYKELGKPYNSKRLRRYASLLSIKASKTLLFPTEAMCKMVEKHMSLAGKDKKILHYGFDPESFFNDDADEPEIVQQMKDWKKQGYRLLLNISAYSVQKNLEIIIETLPALIASGLKIKFITTLYRHEITLDNKEFDSLMQRVNELGLSDVVVSVGYLKYEQLHYLYEEADVFVFPSFTESFGLPLVEAMASGMPVIASNTAVNQEVCGEAASYFDTFNVKSCCETIARILGDSAERKRMEKQSLERAQYFSWKSYTTSLLEVFRNAL